MSVQRTARQIKVDPSYLQNKNVKAKIGTVDNRNHPETVYIEICFWLKPKDTVDMSDISYLKRKISKELKDIYQNELKELIGKNHLFPRFEDNIFIVDIPENIFYNSKKNFFSIELYLHTINLNSKTKYALNKTEDSELFNECIKIINCICNNKTINQEGDFVVSVKK